MPLTSRILGLATATGGLILAFVPPAAASGSTVVLGVNDPTTYTVNTPTLDGVYNAPWNTSQADTAAGKAQLPSANLFPTYTPAAGTTTSTQLSNMASLPGATKGTAPYRSGQAGTPGPVDGYCSSGGPAPESGSPVSEPTNTDLPMSPYYFPLVVQNNDGTLTGYFDYRPKDTDEALVSASSSNGGNTWTVNGEALEQNQGYCPDADNNDNGQGHAFVMSVKNTTYLYTLNRVAGDEPGVGLLVHTLTGGESSPLAGLPSSQPVGVDPDSTSVQSVTVPATGSSSPATIALASVGTPGSPTQIIAGQFVDTSLQATGTPSANATTAPDVITCTGLTGTDLTGCTAATTENVGAGDTVEQVVATVSGASSSGYSIPAGPNTANEKGGLSSLTITLPATLMNTLGTAEINNLGGGRVYIDGNPVYCEGVSNSGDNITLTYCTAPSGFTAHNGDPVQLDPIVPSGTETTTGLVAPDGIVGVIPNYPGAPNGDTTIIYGEKILNFFVPTSTTAAVPATATNFSIGVGSTAWIGSQYYAAPYYNGLNGFGTGTAATFTFGDAAGNNGYDTVSCASYSASALTGCNYVSLTTGATGIPSGAEVGIPGAAAAPYTALAETGEGTSASPTTLYGNNEDYTILAAAYTGDGTSFSSADLANDGVISDTSEASSTGDTTSYSGVNNPTATVSPSATTPYDNPVGATEPTELRFTGTRGSIIDNKDGSYTMFLSGAWATDGDSDAFNQVFVSNSTNGVTWSPPVTVISTDYTFSARETQDAALAGGQDEPLNVSGYYSGRAYGPTVVVDPTTGVVTIEFAGYSTPKPLPKLGSGALGTASTTWTPTVSDPALYRDILTETLTPQPPVQTPEAPLTLALPLSAVGLLGGGLILMRRRRRPAV